MSPTHSLLVKSYIDIFLKVAKENLERDGDLMAILSVKLADNRIELIQLVDFMFAQNSIERQAVLSELGQQIRDKKGHIHEAVLLSGAWCVTGHPLEAASAPPSQHPARQEVITIFGRNAENTRSTVVIQPYIQDTQQRFDWQASLIADYNQPVTQATRPLGVIDALFEVD